LAVSGNALEAEIASLKKIVKRLKAEMVGNADEAA